MARGFDTAFAKTAAAKAVAIKAAGYGFVVLYYFRASDWKQRLGPVEAQAISAVALDLVAVWESGDPTSVTYFSVETGAADGASANSQALAAGQPSGTPIYLAVDYDASAEDVGTVDSPGPIALYFQAARPLLKASGYSAGVYGSGLICKALSEMGLVSHTWLSQSHGFNGYEEWLPFANIVQGPAGIVLGITCDEDASNDLLGGGGWRVS